MAATIVFLLYFLYFSVTTTVAKDEDNDLATTCFPLDRALDVLVILDGSGSVGGNTFDIQIKMLKRIIDAVEIGGDKTKIAVLQYSGYTKVEFDFNEHNTKEELTEAISKIRYLSGTTRTGRALKKALEMFTKEHGARAHRNDVAQVTIVVTDGHSQDDPVPYAEALRKAGVTILAVGIGDYVNMAELLEIAIDTSHTFRNESLEKFDETFRKIAIGEVCTYAKGTKGAEIICGNDSIQVNVLTRRPFEGHLYVKGRFNDPSCSFHAKKGGNSKDISLRIPLMGCGLEEQFIFEPRGLLFESTAILMFNPEYNTERDKAFTIRCFYPDMRFGGPNITEIRKLNENKDKLIPFKDDVSLSAEKLANGGSIISSFNVPQMRPPCAYVIRKSQGPGCISDGISIGDKIVHQWECDTGNVRQEYVMFVHSCFVMDGQGQKKLVLDTDGCPIDSTVMAEPVYIKPLLIQMETSAVKFADRSTLKFRCSLKFCNTRTQDCDALAPADCQEVGSALNRTKRAAIPASAQALPQSILDRLRMRQKSMMFHEQDALLQANSSNELDDQPIVFPPMKPFVFTANNSQSSSNNDTKISQEKPTNKNAFTINRDPFKLYSSNFTNQPDVDSFDSTVRPTLKMDDHNLNRLWQAVIGNFTVRPILLNESLNERTNKSSVQNKINNKTDNRRENDTLIEIVPGFEPGAPIHEMEDKEAPHRFELSGLSDQIIANLKFDQIELNSQMIMVHEIEDTDVGKSPVDFCPPPSNTRR